MPLLYGLHDREGRHIVPAGGWCVDTRALAHNDLPTDYAALRGDINWIVRLNWGYGSEGTIPLPVDYDNFAARCANYVAKSNGANIWIIGNETNHEQERPNGVFITPEQYARCFKLCRDMIKRSFPNAQVIPAPCAPYHANPIPWTDYLTEMLQRIAANGGCDGIAVHTYTRSSNPADIESGAQMGPPLQNTYSGFLSYLDALDCVPASMLRLPVYITEFNELLPEGWHDANTGVVQAAYADIDSTNRSGSGNLPIQCLILYRWPKFDKWHIEGKQGVIDDFNAAIGRDYTSPVNGKDDMTETLYIPTVSPGTVAAPALPPVDWDPRLTARGVKVVASSIDPGEKYWRVVRARWYNEQESQGRHHIYVEALDESGEPLADVPFKVAWPSGVASGQTNGRSGFDAGNFPMSKSLNEFSVAVGGGEYPFEILTGIGMGANGNSGIHTSTGVTFQLVTMPAIEAPPPAPVESPKEPSMQANIIEPRVAQAILRIESGGRTFGENGKPIIRFEAHIFRQQLGDDEAWNHYFSTDATRGWVDQKFRKSPSEPWRTLHTGNQADEYVALTVAERINREAAYKSISMGAAQIMGFNHTRVGYSSARAMFKAFEDAPMQTLGFINFCLSDPELMDAIRRRDWREIAARYNGTGAIDTYSKLLQDAYSALGG